ncbi:hypothetical protein F5148DRAFT_983049, partial [Russula earlei]
VAFREMVMARAEFAYTRKKQTGSVGQHVHVIEHIEPMKMNVEPGDDTASERV